MAPRSEGSSCPSPDLRFQISEFILSQPWPQISDFRLRTWDCLMAPRSEGNLNSEMWNLRSGLGMEKVRLPSDLAAIKQSYVRNLKSEIWRHGWGDLRRAPLLGRAAGIVYCAASSYGRASQRLVAALDVWVAISACCAQLVGGGMGWRCSFVDASSFERVIRCMVPSTTITCSNDAFSSVPLHVSDRLCNKKMHVWRPLSVPLLHLSIQRGTDLRFPSGTKIGG